MREVLYKKWIPAVWPEGTNSSNQHTTHRPKEGTNCWGRFTEPGLFHRWGQAYEEFESGPGNYTVALVEKPDGEIAEVLPSNIKFLSPPE